MMVMIVFKHTPGLCSWITPGSDQRTIRGAGIRHGLSIWKASSLPLSLAQALFLNIRASLAMLWAGSLASFPAIHVGVWAEAWFFSIHPHGCSGLGQSLGPSLFMRLVS